MISIAAKSWGVTSKDIEKSDPIVPLLIDACASEIARIDSSISGSSDKMGWKIMEMLTPLELTSPYPARAILTAMPMDTSYDLKEKNEFYFENRMVIKDDVKNVDIFFTPTGNFKLIKGDVRYLAHYKSLVHKPEPFERQVLCKATGSKEIEPNTCWIGLHVAKSITSLENVSFHFDFDIENSKHVEEEMFFHALSNSNWEINGHSINVSNGYGIYDEGFSSSHQTNSVAEFTKSKSICNHVNNFYQKKFYTIHEEKSKTQNYLQNKAKYPPEFESIFGEEALDELEGNIIWIKINFSQYLPAEIFQKIDCAINCFPVINRRKEKVYITGKEKIKGLVSEENEVFFDLKQLTADGDLTVSLDRNNAAFDENKALLALRHDNIGRFNSRNALELIQQMVDSYREEFQAFSNFKSIDQDAVEGLSHAIRPFENVLEELYDVSFDSMPYIMLKTSPENEDVNIQVDYWLTNGVMANDIRKEENLRYDSAELMKGSIFLVTNTAGGVDRKRNEELTNDFRYALLTRDRVVTKGDIKALCYKVFSGFVERITVEEGITSTSHSNSGIRRSMNIYINLNQHHHLSKEAINFLKEDLITQLNEKSSNILPFNVSVKKN